MSKRKATKKLPSQTAAPPISLADIHARLVSLESHVRNVLPKSGEGGLTLHASPPAEARSLAFSLAQNSSQKVRVTLDHSEVVLFNSWSKPSAPRNKGDWVSVLIEVMGNPGDTAIVNISNSDPAQLTSAAIPAGMSSIADPRLLQATW